MHKALILCICTVYKAVCCTQGLTSSHSPEEVLVQYWILADYLQCHYSTLSVFSLINPCSFSYKLSEVNSRKEEQYKYNNVHVHDVLVVHVYTYTLARLKSKPLSFSTFLVPPA